MIRELRRRHGTLGVGALALAPAALVLAIVSARPTMSPAPELVSPLVPDPPTGASTQLPALGVAIRSRVDRSGDVIVWFRATRPIAAADPLLYWTPVASAPNRGNSATDRALLLGSLSRREAEARIAAGRIAGGGSLLVWDGAHQRIVGLAPADGLPK